MPDLILRPASLTCKPDLKLRPASLTCKPGLTSLGQIQADTGRLQA